ncbi:MAG: YcxB family protein [Akkermansiaceae bacterium]|nr:YcxB family protein [Armatimonadota bacterium]
MTIRYVTAPADMGAFHMWWLQNDPEGRSAVHNHVFRVCTLFALFCGLLAWLTPSESFLMLAAALIGIGATMLLTPAGIRKKFSAQAVRMYSSSTNATLFGQRTLEINDEGILSISANATALYKWESFAAITATDTHAFLTVGTMMALVISRDTVAEGNLDAFVAEAKRLHKRAVERVPVPAMAL